MWGPLGVLSNVFGANYETLASHSFNKGRVPQKSGRRFSSSFMDDLDPPVEERGGVVGKVSPLLETQKC